MDSDRGDLPQKLLQNEKYKARCKKLIDFGESSRNKELIQNVLLQFAFNEESFEANLSSSFFINFLVLYGKDSFYFPSPIQRLRDRFGYVKNKSLLTPENIKKIISEVNREYLSLVGRGSMSLGESAIQTSTELDERFSDKKHEKERYISDKILSNIDVNKVQTIQECQEQFQQEFLNQLIFNHHWNRCESSDDSRKKFIIFLNYDSANKEESDRNNIQFNHYLYRLTKNHHDRIVSEPDSSKNIMGETCVQIEINAEEFEQIKNHDAKVLRCNKAKELCSASANTPTVPALAVDYLDETSISLTKNELSKSIAALLNKFCIIYAGQEKKNYVRHEDILREIRVIAKNYPDKTATSNKITANLKENIVQVPENNVFMYPLVAAKDVLRDGRVGRKANSKHDGFTQQYLKDLLRFTSDPIAQLDFIEVLFELIKNNNDDDRYTYTGHFACGGKPLLTTTQQKHIKLLKIAYAKIISENYMHKKTLMDPVLNQIANKKDNIIDFNTANFFKAKVTNTRMSINAVRGDQQTPPLPSASIRSF
jgi:hypothetical protein